MANRIQLRRDTTANWANVNPILSDGEMGYDINTNEIRIGDGSTEWTGLSGNTIGGGGGAANTGDVTFNGINIIGDDNLRFQPNTTVTDGYVDIYLTTGPDIHIDHSGGNLILGPDNWANVRLATEGNVQIRAQDGTSISTWTFNPNGNLILPLGSNISETATTTVISPPGASAGQSLVIRPTGQFYLSASGNIVAGANLTITLTNNVSPTATQFNYTITGATAEQLGIGSLTGSFPVLSPPDEVPQSSSIVLPIPAESNATTVTLTIDSDQGEGAANVTITVTGNAVISSESSHVHLLSGNPATVDLYLGDDDQYVKIEKNAGNVVIGTNTNTHHWRFGTDGTLTLPAVGGDEGAEIAFGKAANSGLSGNTIVVDQFVNRLRFFESGGGNRGAYIDLAQAASTVGTLLNNRVSGFVNAGANVIMDSLKATVTTSDQRGLSLAATTGSFEANVAGTYANVGGTGGSRASVSITTTPSASLFGWDFTIAGDMATYIITDSTNSRAYRVTMQIGNGFDNNMISIERLV